MWCSACQRAWATLAMSQIRRPGAYEAQPACPTLRLGSTNTVEALLPLSIVPSARWLTAVLQV